MQAINALLAITIFQDIWTIFRYVDVKSLDQDRTFLRLIVSLMYTVFIVNEDADNYVHIYDTVKVN